MESIYTNAILVAMMFFAIKMIELKFVNEETTEKPLKHIVKDSVVVYVCYIIGAMIYGQFFPSIGHAATNAFVNKPDF
jgi:hypothetical protein